MADAQTFKNHGRVVPSYHVGVFFPFLINFLWAAYRIVREPSGGNLVALLVAVALLVMFLSVRGQILRVQDRVIRLEMRLRLRALLPADLQAHIDTLTVKQLVALRFASDAEMPSLIRDVLAGKLASQKEIKAQVKEWQPDYLRA